MKTPVYLAVLFTAILSLSPCDAQDFTADQLIAKVLDGRKTSGFRIHARLVRMLAGSEQRAVQQLLVKGRQDGQSSLVLYRLLWPKAVLGQALLVDRSNDQQVCGWLFEPPGKVTALTPQLARQSFFGSDLSIEDITEDFWHWPSQTIIGEETFDHHRCKILESRPAAGSSTSYSRVKSWVALDLALPLRLEKFDKADKLAKRFTTEKIHRDSHGRTFPAILRIEPADGVGRTWLEGTKFERDLVIPIVDFTVQRIKQS